MFLGLGGVVFGVQGFGANLARPVQSQIAQFASGEEFLTEDQREDRDREAAKSKDTDGDGLVDYDELYVYKTSPYIADSDSDGYSDKDEIYSGNNPNCPTGKTCGFVVSTVEEGTGTTSAVQALVEGLDSEGLLEAGAVTFESEADVQAFFKTATMKEIRASLIEAGMSQEELDLIDDETLEAFFYGVLDQAASSGELSDFVTPQE